jgi:hypothetical protein
MLRLGTHRFHVGKDGKTCDERLKGKSSQRPIVQFGECVWFKPIKRNSDNMAKYEARWYDGVWIGINERSGEGIVMCGNQVVKCRCIRRKPPSERWNGHLLKEFTKPPWAPNGEDQDHRITTRLRRESDEEEVSAGRQIEKR